MDIWGVLIMSTKDNKQISDCQNSLEKERRKFIMFSQGMWWMHDENS